MAVALVLSLGAAVSLGITRFAYGLLLPPMRADLSWSYTFAGSMNTSNALGYFIGALLAPMLLRRFGAGAVLCHVQAAAFAVGVDAQAAAAAPPVQHRPRGQRAPGAAGRNAEHLRVARELGRG